MPMNNKDGISWILKPFEVFATENILGVPTKDEDNPMCITNWCGAYTCPSLCSKVSCESGYYKCETGLFQTR